MANLKSDELLRQAWEVQFTGTTSRLIDVDVEKECLERLEEDMFEVSFRAGIAGYYQWGLDSGHHDNWDPYYYLPADWNVGDYLGDEGDLEV